MTAAFLWYNIRNLIQGVIMRRLLMYALTVIIFNGCEKKIEVSDKQYADLPNDDTLFCIEGNNYLKKTCEEDAKLICVLKKKPGRRNKDIIVTDRERSFACSNFISYVAIKKAMHSKGVRMFRDIDDKSVKAIALKSRFAKNGISELALKRHLERNIALNSYVNFVVSNDYPVTLTQIVNAKNRIKWDNEIAEATNALVYATASNVYSRIQSGEDFLELAKKYDELPVHGGPGEWGRITASWYSDDVEFLKLLKNTPEGGITPPIEADEGLLIVKVLSKKTIEENEEQKDIYDLQRIYFRLPIFYKEEGDEEIKKNIHKAKCQKLAREIIDKAINDVVVEYPNGKIKWEIPRTRKVGHNGKK
jgi:hypothetical protein